MAVRAHPSSAGMAEALNQKRGSGLLNATLTGPRHPPGRSRFTVPAWLPWPGTDNPEDTP